MCLSISAYSRSCTSGLLMQRWLFELSRTPLMTAKYSGWSLAYFSFGTAV